MKTFGKRKGLIQHIVHWIYTDVIRPISTYEEATKQIKHFHSLPRFSCRFPSKKQFGFRYYSIFCLWWRIKDANWHQFWNILLWSRHFCVFQFAKGIQIFSAATGTAKPSLSWIDMGSRTSWHRRQWEGLWVSSNRLGFTSREKIFTYMRKMFTNGVKSENDVFIPEK